MSELEILKGLELIYESDFITNLRKTVERFPLANFKDAMSKGQIESKKWLIKTLEEKNPMLGSVLLVGGWYGLLPSMMFESEKLQIEKLRSIDKDSLCAKIADTINRHNVIDGWKFKASTADMYELNYELTNHITHRFDGSECNLTETFDTVINTSCEHLQFFSKWLDLIPNEKLLVLQSNNFFEGKDHVNCVSSLSDFEKQCSLSSVLYSGVLTLEKYDRYMIIGKK